MSKPPDNEPAEDLKTKAARGAFVNIVAQAIAFVSQTVGVIVLARILSPHDFGIVAMVTAFSVWLMNFGLNGFTEYIIQKRDISNEEVSAIFWLHVLIATITAFLFVIFGYFLVGFYDEPALFGISVAMASSFIFCSLYTCHFALLKREMRFISIAMVELFAMILSVVLAISAALSGLGYWAVVTRQLTIPAVMMISSWFISSWRPSHRTLKAALPGLKYTLKIYCNLSLGLATKNVDKILLGRFHGAFLLGQYDRAFFLASVPATQMLNPLQSVALSTLSKLQHDPTKFTSYFLKATSLVSFIGTIGALIMTLTAQDIIFMLLGPEWSQAGKIVMAFGPGIAASLVYGTISWLHLSLGTPARWVKWNICAVSTIIVSFIITAPLGGVAMAIAMSLCQYILVLPGLWYAGKPIGLKISAVIKVIWAFFASGFFVFFLWVMLPPFWPPLDLFLNKIGPLFRFIVVSTTASLAYLVFVSLLQMSFKTYTDFWRIFVLIMDKRG
jgi:PST family polysaccharide transporter